MQLYHNGKLVDRKQTKICMLYDPKNGRIVHVHAVTSIAGGKPHENTEIEKRAFERAKSLGRETTGLKPLHVSPDDIKPHTVYMVDVNRKVLIESKSQTRFRDSRKQKK